MVAQRAGTLHATHELEGDCARCGTARRYQGAISRARPARTADANRHLHGLLHRTRRTPPARGAPTAALIGPVMAKARRLAHELEERRALVVLVRVRPAEAPRLRGRGRPWFRSLPGPFPPWRASAALNRRLEHAVSLGNGRPPFWERPSRALPDPEDFSHASNAIRPPRAAAVNKTHQRGR